MFIADHLLQVNGLSLGSFSEVFKYSLRGAYDFLWHLREPISLHRLKDDGWGGKVGVLHEVLDHSFRIEECVGCGNG